VISRSCVSLIMWTGGAYRPFLHDRHFNAALVFQNCNSSGLVLSTFAVRRRISWSAVRELLVEPQQLHGKQTVATRANSAGDACRSMVSSESNLSDICGPRPERASW
jgi:hypothetical protein